MLFLLQDFLSGNLGLEGAIIYIISSLLVIFLTMPVHEFAHGFAAVKLGDNTPRWQGRLSLNPFAHIDYIGALCILLFGFGWAKPVQVNGRNLKNPKRDMALVALAGPLSNIVLAFVALLLFYLVQFVIITNSFSYIGLILFYIARINVSLAVFNLIPIPPLDGSRLLSALLPYKQYYALMRYERYIFWGLIALMYLGVLDVPITLLTNAVMQGLSTIAKLPFTFLIG